MYRISVYIYIYVGDTAVIYNHEGKNTGRTLGIHIFDSDKEQSSKQHLNHSKLLPNGIRCIIAGPSNSGKTNLLFNLLLHPNGLKYENIYIYSTSLFQPRYVFLENVLLQVCRQ